MSISKEQVGNAVGRYNRLISHVQGLLLEKEEQVKICYHAMAIGEHVVLYGKPGNAKSKTVNTVMASIKDAIRFKYLISETTLPKEILGDKSIKGLRDDKSYFIIDGNLPTAHLASLEEGFSGNSFTLGAMNMITNEREFNNGNQLISCPLISAFIPTNFEPDEDAAAFFDRFLYRLRFRDFQNDQVFKQFIENEDAKSSAFHVPEELRFPLEDLLILKNAALALPIDEAVIDAMISMRSKIINKFGKYISPRRWDTAKKAMRIAALLDGCDEVTPGHVGVMKHILWDRQDQEEEIATLVDDLADPYASEYRKTRDLFVSMKSVMEQSLADAHDDDAGETIKARVIMETLAKVRVVVMQLSKIKGKSPELSKLHKEVVKFKDDLKVQAVK